MSCVIKRLTQGKLFIIFFPESALHEPITNFLYTNVFLDSGISCAM